jgi:hypothetical protein
MPPPKPVTEEAKTTTAVPITSAQETKETEMPVNEEKQSFEQLYGQLLNRISNGDPVRDVLEALSAWYQREKSTVTPEIAKKILDHAHRMRLASERLHQEIMVISQQEQA